MLVDIGKRRKKLPSCICLTEILSFIPLVLILFVQMAFSKSPLQQCETKPVYLFPRKRQRVFAWHFYYSRSIKRKKGPVK